MTRILVTARSGHSVTLLSELAELLQASASFDADNLSEVST